MGYEGLDGSQDVANEEKKHPWEIFPEDDSASAKDGGKKKHEETPAQREEKKARREKREAKFNSATAWMKKNVVLTAGIILAVIAVIIGMIFLIINLTKPKVEPETEPIEVEQLRIPDNFAVEETVTPDYAYTIIRMQLAEATKNTYLESGEPDIAKFEDAIDEYIKKNVSVEDKPAYELTKIVLINNAGDSARAEYLSEQFDEGEYELGHNTRYIYLTAKVVYYATTGNIQEESKWRELLKTEYLDHQVYLDMDTYEATEDGYSGVYVSDDSYSQEAEEEDE